MFGNFEKEIIVILTAAAPISELRGAIPLAIFGFGFSAWKAFLLSVFGNLLPIIPVLFFLPIFSNWLSNKSDSFKQFFTWLFNRTKTKHNKHFEIWKELALLVFVAIPLPLTGAWSGVLAAYVFGVPFWRAVLMIGLGVIISGVIVVLLSGAVKFIL